MKRIALLIIMTLSLSLSALAFSASANAVDIFRGTCNAGGAGSGSTVCKSVSDQQGHLNQNPIITIIKGAIDVISFLVGIAAIIGLVVSGLRLITSGGNAESVASARSGITYSLVGIMVVVLAQTIVVFALGG